MRAHDLSAHDAVMRDGLMQFRNPTVMLPPQTRHALGEVFQRRG